MVEEPAATPVTGMVVLEVCSRNGDAGGHGGHAGGARSEVHHLGRRGRSRNGEVHGEVRSQCSLIAKGDGVSDMLVPPPPLERMVSPSETVTEAGVGDALSVSLKTSGVFDTAPVGVPENNTGGAQEEPFGGTRLEGPGARGSATAAAQLLRIRSTHRTVRQAARGDRRGPPTLTTIVAAGMLIPLAVIFMVPVAKALIRTSDAGDPATVRVSSDVGANRDDARVARDEVDLHAGVAGERRLAGQRTRQERGRLRRFVLGRVQRWAPSR